MPVVRESDKMDISDYLKSDSPTGTRLASGDCWIYFDNDSNQWVLMEQIHRRQPRVLGRYSDEEAAVGDLRRTLGEIE